MPTLQVEHPVPDYDAWKAAFDGDPIGRRRSGVRRYRVMRPVGEPHYVVIHLDFDSLGEAESAQAALRALWTRVDVMHEPRSRIVETLEEREYSPR